MPGKFISDLSRSLGELRSWEKSSHEISGQTSNARFRLRFFSPGVVNLCITNKSEFEDFSYAVVQKSATVKFTVEEHAEGLLIKTDQLQVSIGRKNTHIVFKNTAGKIINEDDPELGTCWNGDQVTTYKKLQEGERFIGLGEKTGPLDRRGAGYVNWNTDNFGYGTGSDPLYCSIPFYIGVHNGLSYGIFLDNSFKTFFNFGASNNRFSSFAADAGEMNYYFIYGNTVADIIRDYTLLTGRMEMPPLWSIGYQQCRYSYYPDREVLNVANTFREKDIPCDVIVLDIHYMEKYKIFTWSKKDFSDPQRLLKDLKALGFEIVLMCDPGIKVEPGYHTYDDGVQKDVFIKYPDGKNYTGQVWPGWCHFPDFTRPQTRQWWKEQLKDYVDLGVQGFWNDMNEIATWGNMLPENIEMDFEGNKASMRRGRNVYAMQMARATYEGTKSQMQNRRPFNLTRAGFSGIQRYAAVWTGDNVAYDEHMMLGVRIVNSMGLSGIAFAGYDVGGFVGNADSKLFARWVSIGAFSPFFRGHSMINSRDSEPWSYGEETEQISRNYIKFRYQILPYIYALFHEAATTGMPVQRSLAINYTHSSKVYESTFHHQYLFGPSFLVAPVESNKEFVKAFLPDGSDWYSLYNGTLYSGNCEMIFECPLHRLPVFVKSGSIIPMQTATSHVNEKTDTLFLHVYAGKNDSSFDFYEDDGTTFEYQQNQFSRRRIEFKPNEKKIIIGKTEGKYNSGFRNVKLILHGFAAAIEEVKVNGAKKTLLPEVNRFFSGLEKFDPIKEPEPAPEENVKTIEFANDRSEILIQW
jgi:alpha-glucosidase